MKTKKVIVKFKDEAAGKPILGFFGVKSKMYSCIKEEYKRIKLEITKVDDRFKFEMVKAEEDEKFIKKYVESGDKKAKGVKKNAIRREISHSDYQDVLFHNRKMHHQMKSIQSERHQISSFQSIIVSF